MSTLGTLVTADFTSATINYAAILPMLVVFGFALVGTLVEAFVPRGSRYRVQVVVTLVGLVVAFLAIVLVAVNNQTATAGLFATGASGAGGSIKGSVVIDGPGLFLQGAVLVLSLMGVLTMAERHGRRRVRRVHPDGVLHARIRAGGARRARGCRHLGGLPPHPLRRRRHDALPDGR